MRKIPAGGELVNRSFVEKIPVSEISEYPKGSASWVGRGGSSDIRRCYNREFFRGPNPNWSFFEDQPPWIDMNISWIWGQGLPAKFFNTKLDHPQWCAALVFDQEHDPAIRRNRTVKHGINESDFSRYMGELDEFHGNHQGHWSLYGGHYLRLALSGFGCDPSAPVGAQEHDTLEYRHAGQYPCKSGKDERVETYGVGRYPKRLSFGAVGSAFIFGALMAGAILLVSWVVVR